MAQLGARPFVAVPRFGSTLLGRAGGLARRQLAQRAAARDLRSRGGEVLPSLYDRYPEATKASRLARGIQFVPLEKIVGTERHPSQNTADFRPLPQLRGVNWEARWQRINRANDRLAILPPVDLVKVGDDFYISDGHNRVASALAAGAVGVDADVTELALPGVDAGPPTSDVGASLAQGALLRDAGSGRLSRASLHDEIDDAPAREQVLRAAEPDRPSPSAPQEEEP